MRSGRFEPHQQPDGRRLFRLRWKEESVPLTSEELRRLEFLRFLLGSGRVSELREP